MDLKEFVSRTDIQEGVAEAIKRHTERQGIGGISVVFKKGADVNWSEYVKAVEFDIAVTTTDNTSGTAKAGVKVFDLADFGGDVSKNLEKGVANRIKFSVPILFPAQVFQDDGEDLSKTK